MGPWGRGKGCGTWVCELGEKGGGGEGEGVDQKRASSCIYKLILLFYVCLLVRGLTFFCKKKKMINL